MRNKQATNETQTGAETMTSQKRATRGGEVGANGEWYDGGRFIATTEKPKSKASRKGTGRKEIEPCKYDTPPSEQHFAIFQIVGAQAAWVDRYDAAKGIKPHAPGVAYYGDTTKGYTTHELCDLYNAGERWVEEK